jgi:hypothetical protein
LAGRTPAAAFANFVTPLQQDISCLTNDVLIVSSGGRHLPNKIHALTLANGLIRLRAAKMPPGLTLGVGLQYDIVQTDDPARGPYKVRTRGYDYAFRDADGRTMASYHWHPLGESRYKGPHFHMPTELEGVHWPCERTSLESMIRFAIEEIDVQPNRSDWDDLLTINEGRFKLWRSWSMRPELAKDVEEGPQPMGA